MSTERIANFIVQTKSEQIPGEAIEVAKKGMLDLLGCALAGSGEPASRIVREYVSETGGRPEASVIIGNLKIPAAQAALANGVMAHVLDYDDYGINWLGHPSVALFPAVLALGETKGASGRDILEAYIIGWEVGAKLCMEFGAKAIERGWHPTVVVGSVAGAAACARLLKLDVQKTRMALGIAASEAGGLRLNFGTDTKSFHAGRAASNGVIAGILAQKGLTANGSILEGDIGFSQAFSWVKCDIGRVASQLGKPWDISSEGGACIKPYPSCALTHKSIDAMLYLAKEYDLKPADVASIECSTHSMVRDVLVYQHPKTGLEGKFSPQYCVAAALLHREAGLKQFTTPSVLAPEAQQLVEKVKHTHPAGADRPEEQSIYPQEVIVRLKNGKEYRRKVESAKGYPSNPMTWDETAAKFKDCAHTFLSEQKIKRCIALMSGLESLKDIRELAAVIQ